MSFSKAKIQRFNERGSEAPPPGAYDPKFDTKVKGIVLEKKERFPDSKSVCSSGAESHVSTASKASSNLVTNQLKANAQMLVKKRVIVKPQFMNVVKSKLYKSPKSPKITTKALSIHNAKYKISDLKVDCANKQKTIEEYEEQIVQLERDLELLRIKIFNLQEQEKEDLKEVESMQSQILDSCVDKYTTEIEHLNSQIKNLNEVHNKELTDLKEKITSLETEISNANLQIKDLNKIHYKEVTNLKAELTSVETELANANQQISELQFVETDRKQELDTIKLEKLKLIEFCQKFTDFKHFNVNELLKSIDELEDIKKRIQLETESLEKDLKACPFADDSFTSIPKLILNFQSDCLDFMIKTCKNYKEECEASDCLENSYLLKENDELREQLQFESVANQELQKNLRNLKTDKDMLKKQLETLKKKIEMNKKLEEDSKKLRESKVNEEMQALRLEKERLEKKCIELVRKTEEFDKLYVTKEKELAEMKKYAEKMIENAEAVTRETVAACRNESEDKVKKIIVETDAKIEVKVQEARNSAKEEIKTIIERYETSLKKVESEKKELTTKLTEKETEINWLTSALEEMKTTAETQESFSQSLQEELDRVETELAEKKEELRSLKDKIRSESAEMVDRRKRFEVVMQENQASINALMQRLAQSNTEVERLQREVKNGELSMHEHRDLLNAMRNNSKLTSEQVFALLDQLDTKRNLIDQIEINNIADIESMREVFEKKIDSLKQIINVEIKKYEEECRQKNSQNQELKQQLEQMTQKIRNAQDLLLKLEEQNDEYEIELTKLQLANSKLEKSLKEKNDFINNREATIVNQCEAKIEEANKKIANLLERQDNMQDTLIILQNEYVMLENEKLNYEINEQQLKENFEKEISRRLKLEEQIKTLNETCERYKEEYQEISEKYSEILGHNNMKQRVKHVTQLKDKIYAQQSEILRLKQDLELKNKNIDLLKSNEKRVYSKGKENMQKSENTSKKSLNRQTSTPLTKNSNATVVSSSSPHGPLRHRNE